MRRSTLLTSLLLILLLFCGNAVCACSGSSPNWTAASISAVDVAACITAASAGDTITVSGGSTSTWASLTDNKGITLLCSGTCTISTSAAAYLFSCPSGTHFGRITGFSFTGIGNSNNGDVEVDGSVSGTCTARIDHNTFTNAGQSVFVTFNYNTGNSTAQHFLADHNTFNGGDASEIIHNVAWGPGSNVGWINDVIPGSSNMVVIEDNIFNCTSTSFTCSAVQAYYGAVTVVRHNVMHYSAVDEHGTPGAVGARWWEVYDNVFWPDGKNQSNYAQIRGGSGVYWGNSVTLSGGSNSGAGVDQFAEEDTTSPECAGSNAWPCLWQIGMGRYSGTPNNTTTFHSSPVYYWGNDVNETLQLNGMSSNTTVQLNRDLFSSGSQPATLTRCESAADVTAGCPFSYSYSPLTYPDPLIPTNSSKHHTVRFQ